MHNNSNHVFCPMCGALLRDGACPCCKYGADAIDIGNQADYDNSYSNQSNGFNDGTNNDPYSVYRKTDSYGDGINQKTQKSSNTAAIITGTVMLFIAIAAIVTVSIIALNYANTHSSDKSYDSYMDDWDYDWDYDWDDDDLQSELDNEWEDGYNPTDFTDEIDWDDTSWSKEATNYSADEVWDGNHQYYEYLNNCINTDVSYKVKYFSDEQLDKKQNVCMRSTYYQLVGDIPNIDVINEKIKETALEDSIAYFDQEDVFIDEFETYGAGYVVSAETYVTYNDEKIISFVTYSQYESATMVGSHLNCVTVDLSGGIVLENTDILNIDEQFVKDIINGSDKQNGKITYLSETSIQTLQKEFEDPDACIVFYTPCGLEVGLNYASSYSYGWFTTTLTDYNKYMKFY